MDTIDLRLAAADRWIDLVPEDRYGLCPCGCGKKMKFVLPEVEQHYANFVAHYISEQSKPEAEARQ